jgi:transcriptional regulator with XRE-family HTH domain
LAFEAEVHRTYVSDIERAKRNATATMLEKLAKPLGVAPGRLLD